MLINYLKVAFRNLLINKVFSIINIAGLCIGMTSCIFILLWVHDELSFDRFHSNSKELFRVVEEQHFAGGQVFPIAITPGPLAPALKEKVPEILNSTRYLPVGRRILKSGKKRFIENGIVIADPSFIQMFSFPLLKGDPNTALSDIHSIILTENMAKKYFGDQNPIGMMLLIDNEYNFKVTGVLENTPQNSHLKFDFIIPFVFLKELGQDLSMWDVNSYYTYVLLQENVPYQKVNEKITDFIKNYSDESVTELDLQPLEKIHLYSDYTADIQGNGDIFYVRIFTIIALFVLLIACINYMNLSTARSSKRAREVGLRKVVGASKRQLLRQFMGESVIISFFSLLLATVLVELLMNVFNNISGKQLSINIFSQGYIFLGLLGIALLAGILAGSYPAFFFSSFKPINVLKGIPNYGNISFRRLLVVIQFALSVILMIGATLVFRQLNFIQDKRLGINDENLIYFQLNGGTSEKYPAIKDELLRNPDILGVTATNSTPVSMQNSMSGWDWDGKIPDEDILMHYVSVDPDYLSTFKIEMREGTFYSGEILTDTTRIVINNKAVERMGIKDPIGKRLTLENGYDFNIIGVVKDFHFKSVRAEIEPLVMVLLPDYYMCFVRIKKGYLIKTIDYINDVWNQFNPEFPFEYTFLEEDYENLYIAENRMGKLFSYFTIFAILISCLGLFGLASFMAELKNKEIGVRKVFGASAVTILIRFSREFTKWIIIANIIAWPVAYLSMKYWLQNFVYKTNIGVWIFISAALASLCIALFTVIYQSLRSATRNPAQVLKYE